MEGPACYASSLLTTTFKSTSLESSPSDANGFSDTQGAALSVSSLRATKTKTPFWSTDRQNVPSSNPSLRATGINMPSSWCAPPLMHPRRVPPDLNCGVSAVASTKDQTRTPRTNELGLEPPLKQPRLQFAASKPHSVEVRSRSPIADISSSVTSGDAPSLFVFGAQPNADDPKNAGPSKMPIDPGADPAHVFGGVSPADKGNCNFHSRATKSKIALRHEPSLKRFKADSNNVSDLLEGRSSFAQALNASSRRDTRESTSVRNLRGGDKVIARLLGDL